MAERVLSFIGGTAEDARKGPKVPREGTRVEAKPLLHAQTIVINSSWADAGAENGPKTSSPANTSLLVCAPISKAGVPIIR